MMLLRRRRWCWSGLQTANPIWPAIKYSAERMGQSYDYTNASWSGTDNYCTIYDLDETKKYCFVARAYDSEGFESGDSVEVCHIPTVIPDNQPPMANAGPDQTVDEGRSVTLNGANSTDPDDGIAAYHWTQTGGFPVALSDPNGIGSRRLRPLMSGQQVFL